MLTLFALVAFSLVVIIVPHRLPPQLPTADNDEAVEFFQHWRLKHGKVYKTPEEHRQRYRVFVSNMKTASILNAGRKSSESAIFGATKFADLTTEEFRLTRLMHYKTATRDQSKLHRSKNSTVTSATSFDWTEKSGVVTSVKNQGNVGTCWAFAGCANVEGQYAIMTGKQCPDLSAEAANDCDGYSDPLMGWVACGPIGATMSAFYVWAAQEGGLMKEKDYPYCIGDASCRPCAPDDYDALMCGQAWPVDPCNEEDSCAAKYNRSKFVPGLVLNGFEIFSDDEGELVNDLVEVGPLVAGIDATDLQLYEDGILHPNECSASGLNHAVLLVGYDTIDGADVWKAKNSWGPDWGEDGFFRIERGTGACGINVDVTSALLLNVGR